MRIVGVVWLDQVVDKLESKHGVMANEVLEVLEQRPWFRFVEKGHRSGEDVYAALGQTVAGRKLIVFIVYRHDAQALIVSARDMTHAERAQYDRR